MSDRTPTLDEHDIMRYTDTENTGLPIVPDLSGDVTERNDLEEIVFSHQQTLHNVMQYTDTENTGLPTVPDLARQTTERDDLEEIVFSHRLTPDDQQ